jgi:hypothetical protein
MTFLAVGGDVDDIARVAERLLQQALQVHIVFNQQNTHLFSYLKVREPRGWPCGIRGPAPPKELPLLKPPRG